MSAEQSKRGNNRIRKQLFAKCKKLFSYSVRTVFYINDKKNGKIIHTFNIAEIVHLTRR